MRNHLGLFVALLVAGFTIAPAPAHADSLGLDAASLARVHAARAQQRQKTGKIMTGVGLGVLGAGLAIGLPVLFFAGESSLSGQGAVILGTVGGAGMLTSVAGATVWSIGNSDAKRALDPRTDWDAIFKKRRRNGYILMGAGTAAAILTVVISAVSLADWGSSWWDDKPDPNRQLRWDLATAGATLSGVTSVVCYAVGSALLAPTQRDLALKVEAAPGGVALRF